MMTTTSLAAATWLGESADVRAQGDQLLTLAAHLVKDGQLKSRTQEVWMPSAPPLRRYR